MEPGGGRDGAAQRPRHRHLWLLLPLDARIKKGWATGKELRAYLEHELELVFSRDPWKLSGGWGPRYSGMSMVFSAFAPPGERLREIRIGGRLIEDAMKYNLAGCERDGESLDRDRPSPRDLQPGRSSRGGSQVQFTLKHLAERRTWPSPPSPLFSAARSSV